MNEKRLFLIQSYSKSPFFKKILENEVVFGVVVFE
jgi:hypothetical protein